MPRICQDSWDAAAAPGFREDGSASTGAFSRADREAGCGARCDPQGCERGPFALGQSDARKKGRPSQGGLPFAYAPQARHRAFRVCDMHFIMEESTMKDRITIEGRDGAFGAYVA